MADQRPPCSDRDLRFAAMVAAHEQRKWDVVREVIRVLDCVRAGTRSDPPDEPTDPRRTG
jgi:hypothetical protein